MTTEQYELLTEATAIYPREKALEYLALGLTSEAGEVSGKIKKYIRGDYSPADLQEHLLGELGDVMWYLTRLSLLMDFTLEDIMKENILKLSLRKSNNTIRGDGDAR